MTFRSAFFAVVPMIALFTTDCLADRAGKSRWLEAKQDAERLERSGGRGFFSNFFDRRENVREAKKEEARMKASAEQAGTDAASADEAAAAPKKPARTASATSSAGPRPAAGKAKGEPVKTVSQSVEDAEGQSAQASPADETLRWKRSSLGKRGGSRSRSQRTRVELTPLFGD